MTAMVTYSLSRGIGESNLVMSLQPSVALVKVSDANGKVYSWRTHLLSTRQHSKAKVLPLRYVAKSLEESICISSVKGFDSNGAVLFESLASDC